MCHARKCRPASFPAVIKTDKKKKKVTKCMIKAFNHEAIANIIPWR